MTTVKFDKSVKYKGVRYAAHEVFKADDKDIDELKKAGAIVLSTDTTNTPPEDNSGSENKEGADGATQGQENETANNGEDGQEDEGDKDIDELKKELLEYTVPELTKFAEEHGIDLQGKTRKADIYNVIVAALN